MAELKIRKGILDIKLEQIKTLEKDKDKNEQQPVWAVRLETKIDLLLAQLE